MGRERVWVSRTIAVSRLEWGYGNGIEGAKTVENATKGMSVDASGIPTILHLGRGRVVLRGGGEGGHIEDPTVSCLD